MILVVWILLIALNLNELLEAQDVQLSIENSVKSQYVGYVWANSKFVFLTPYLKAAAVKGKSVSEKICGFELSSQQLKSVPFIVYLVDELSGLGEIQVKPHMDLDHQQETVMMFTVEAYDCDTLPHYSNRVNVSIHISSAIGPIFDMNAYSFSIKKDSPISTVVGKVSAKGADGRRIKYSFYHAGTLPFGIDESGTIRILSTLKSISNSLVYLRVVATEESASVPKQSIVTVTIEIQPICENLLSGIPDQLDYRIRLGSSGIMDTERLIQDQHQPRLTLCNLPSPLKQIRLNISLIQHDGSDVDSNNDGICEANISASRLQRRICDSNPGTMDLFMDHKGIMYLNEETMTIGPHVLPELNADFTLTWWMKRVTKKSSMIFCIQKPGFNATLSVSIAECRLIIKIGETNKFVDLPPGVCRLNRWLFYSITKKSRPAPTLLITVFGQELAPISVNNDFMPNNKGLLFVGECLSSSVNTMHGQFNQKNQLQIGVISLSKDKSLSTETVGCMSTCGEALLTTDLATKKSPNVLTERRGSSLSFTSTDIREITKVLSKIDYVNTYIGMSIGKYDTEKRTTDVVIDLAINCKSGETISIPQRVIKVKIVLPQRDPTNDTIEVDIYTPSTVVARSSRAIRLFTDFRFINSITEEPVKRDIRLESCSIRPLQRNFIVSEKIYLARVMVPMLMESNLKIRSDRGSWNIEGDGTVELYENLLKHVTFDMVNERRKLFIVCSLKGGDSTSQAFIDIILPKKNEITIIEEENPTEFDHNSLTGQKKIFNKEDKYSTDYLDMTKSKFIAVVIMAVVGGATWAVVTVAVAYFIIRRRGNLKMRNRIKLSDSKSYQRELSPTFHSRPTSGSNPLSMCTHYEYAEDRISMADVPDTDEHCLDTISCDTCNMTDPDNSCINMTATIKDIPRSKTINFPIIHKRF